jgi:FkbM family methyltransferase
MVSIFARCLEAQLADWLEEHAVTHVAMESTGVYWKPVNNLLEGCGSEPPCQPMMTRSERTSAGAKSQVISFAQNAEDVVLARAFAGRRKGFYIDVGAADPVSDSVTKHFYDLGWRGINIDPLPEWHKRLMKARPEDINLPVGLSSERGQMVFYAAEERRVTTVSADVAATLREQGMKVAEFYAEVRTLADVCQEHVGAQEIEFLKIDVEGHERDVILGGDWARWRPLVVLVEATVPNSPVPNHETWEPLLLDAGYVHVLFDGLNRFYVPREAEGLASVLSAPANFFDNYVVPGRYSQTIGVLSRGRQGIKKAASLARNLRTRWPGGSRQR